MRILLASSEAVPYSKTGGLADVASALPKALAEAGHEVWLAVPHYPQVEAARGIDPNSHDRLAVTVEIAVGKQRVTGTVLRNRLPDSPVTVLLIDQPRFFDRTDLYQKNGVDYADNCERFIFFSRSVMEAARTLDLRPDVIHANDWQTGLIPAIAAIEYRNRPGFESTGVVFTIHNMAFQGQFWHWDMLLTGLDWKYFNWRQMGHFDHLNLLKTGIVFADMITTVSPTYAREIRTREFGNGLEGVLTNRAGDLTGILNGIDTHVWNPATDPALARNYSVSDVEQGKPACKLHLQQELGLPARADVPLVGLISRLTEQKGCDLIDGCIEEILKNDVQFCVLGSGESRFEQSLTGLAKRESSKVSVTIGFDEQLAHQIEAGCDMFLMPSRFEPCGLNQMYSIRYGTVPLVRAVGGLADTVIDATLENLKKRVATGFSFTDCTSEALRHCLVRALDTYQDKPRWRQIVKTGMQQDWSWSKSAQEYIDVYRRAVQKHTGNPAKGV